VVADSAWIRQPDPDRYMCAHCRRIALKTIGDSG